MIVLFTDFGLHGPYTGQVKAVLHQMAIIKIPAPNKELHPLRSPKFIQQETPVVCPVSDATGF